MIIKVNLIKSKQIGHDLRRKNREEELKPFDEIIMKQIPGGNVAAAEAKRKEIRGKYAGVQTAIDAASTPDDIKVALGIATDAEAQAYTDVTLPQQPEEVLP